MLVYCAECGSEVQRKLSEIAKSKSGNSFCSKSCAMSFNNRFPNPKRHKFKKTCKSCDTPIQTERTYCAECWSIYLLDSRLDLDNLTKKELFTLSHPHQKIRIDSRRKKLEADLDASCVICGYSTFVDVAHIKPISSFPDNALILEINALSNLLYLCPNHHREFDCGLITI